MGNIMDILFTERCCTTEQLSFLQLNGTGFIGNVYTSFVHTHFKTIFPGADIKGCTHYSNLPVFRINDKGSRSLYYVEISFPAEDESTMIRTKISVIPDPAF